MRLCNLVADGVENDRGMVKVAFNHGSSVLLPPVVKVATVIIGVFAVIPHIKGFIHDVHAQAVTGIQQRFGSRVMGGTDSVESVFLQDAYPPLLTFGIGCRAENSVIMMDAAAAQQGLFAVDEQALVRPCNLPDAERDLKHIVFSGSNSCCIKMGSLGAPKNRIADLHGQTAAFALGYQRITIKNLDLCRDRENDSDGCRIDGNCADFYTFRAEAVLFAKIKPYRAVDAGTGIPAGVGELGVIRYNGERV